MGENNNKFGFAGKTRRLGDIAPCVQSTLPCNDERYWLLNLDVIESNTGKILERILVSKNEVGSSTIRFDTDNVLYSKLRPYLNKVVCPDSDGFATSEILPLKPDQSIITREYLTYYLRSPKFVGYISEKTSGAKMPRANISDLRDYRIEVPTLNQQNIITQQFDQIVRLIDVRKKQLELMDTLIKARFVEMFGDPVSNSKEWKVSPLETFITDIRYGTSTPPKFVNEGYAFIRATNIKNGHIVSEDMKYIPQDEADRLEKCKLRGKELIIVRSGVNAGDTCVVTDEYIGQYAGYDIIVLLGEKLLPEFVNVLINTDYMNKVVKPMTRRAAQPHLNAEQVKSMPIICVPVELQQEYINFVTQVDKLKLFKLIFSI